MNPDLIGRDGEPPRIVLTEPQRELIRRGAVDRVLASAGVGALVDTKRCARWGQFPPPSGRPVARPQGRLPDGSLGEGRNRRRIVFDFFTAPSCAKSDR